MKTIRPVYAILTAAAVSAVLLAGCGGSSGSPKGRILPSKIYYHGRENMIEPGCEAEPHDNTVWPRWMFAGKWIRLDQAETSETISIDIMQREYQYTGLPVPKGSPAAENAVRSDTVSENAAAGETLSEEAAGSYEDDQVASEFAEYAHSYDEPVYSMQAYALPVSLQFDNDISGGETTFGVFYVQDMDCCRVTYCLKDSEDTVSMEAAFDTASDQGGDRLALGLDGLPADAPGFENDRLKLTEYDYAFSWTGCRLTLSYGKDTAVYVPSLYPDGTADSAGFENYWFFTVPGLNSHEFTYLALNGNGYGKVNGFDLLAEQAFSMRYAFGEEGKLTIEREDGLVMDFPGCWVSDNAVTLQWPDGKAGYLLEDSVLAYKVRSQRMEEEFLYHPLDMTATARIDGEENVIYHPAYVSDYIEAGWQVYADLEKSMVPAGATTEPFELRYKGGRITARAVNRFNRELPLRDCSVCWLRIDTGSGDIGLGAEDLRCGEASMDRFTERYKQIYKVTGTEGETGNEGDAGNGQSRLLYRNSLTSLDFGLDDDAYPGTKEQIPVGPYLETQLVFQDDVLQTVTIQDPSITMAAMEKSIGDASLTGLRPGELWQAYDLRSEWISDVAAAAEEFDGRIMTDPSDGTVILDAYDLFVPAGTGLSEEGRELLDTCMEVYGPLLIKHKDFLDCLQITGCSGRAYSSQKSVEWTQKRAEAVLDYLKGGQCPAVQGEVRTLLEEKASAKGIGALDYDVYSFADLPVEPGSARIELRFLQMPGESEADGTKGDSGEVSLQKLDSGDSSYLKADPQTMGEELLQLAGDYEGSFVPDSYTNTALGLTLHLPEGWYFYDATELTTLNGYQASYMLQADLPFDYLRALSGRGDSLINFRFYRMDSRTGGGEEEAAGSLHASQRGQIRAFFGDTSDAFEKSRLAGRDLWRSRFLFRAGSADACKDIYYLWDEERHVLTEITIAAPDSKQTEEIAKRFSPL